jgi:hypothetical protein
MLPKTLEFKIIDPDDERQVALGRAVLSTSTAHNNWIDKKVLTPKEARADLVGRGLISVTIPEDIPEEDIDMDVINGGNQARENMLTATQPPSAGGQGEVRMSDTDQEFHKAISRAYLDPDVLIPDFDKDKIIGGLTEIYRRKFEIWKSEQSFLSRSRRKSFDSVSGEFEEYVDGQLSLLANNFTAYVIEAEETALDSGDEFTDNKEIVRGELINIMMKRLSVAVSEYINQKLE